MGIENQTLRTTWITDPKITPKLQKEIGGIAANYVSPFDKRRAEMDKFIDAIQEQENNQATKAPK